MPCGGIQFYADVVDYPCWVCGEPTHELFCMEWDCTLHRKCLGAFLVSREGQLVLEHGHAIYVDEIAEGA